MNFSSILHVLNILASSFILSPTDNPTCAIRLIAWCCGGCLSWCKDNDKNNYSFLKPFRSFSTVSNGTKSFFSSFNIDSSFIVASLIDK